MTKPEILYVLGAYPRWSETFIRQDLRLLLGLGVPLRPVCLFPGDVPRRPAWPEVACLNPHDDEPVRPPAASVASAGLLQRLGRHLPKTVHTRLSRLRHAALLRALNAMVEQGNIRHIHAEFADLPAVLTAAVAKARGRGYSIGVHARDIHIRSFHPGLMFRRAAFLTACNTAARDAVLAACPDIEARVHLLYHGLELEDWPYRAEPRPPGIAVRLIFVGRLVPKKGVTHLLDALGRLRNRGIGWELTLVGSGPEDEILDAQAVRLGIADWIRRHGVVQRRSVRDLVALADALVVPSVVAKDGDRDGIPNVLLESMALGTPVIGTQAGGLGEVLDESTGWIAEAGDAESMARAIARFRQNPAEVEKRRSLARSRIEERFDAQRLARSRAELFQSLLDS